MSRLVVALAGIIVAASIFAAEPATQQPLPDGVLGVVEFQNLTQFQTNVLAYAEAVQPGLGKVPLSGPLFVQLGMCTNIASLDAARPVRILLLKGALDADRAAGVFVAVRAFTVTDAAAYRKGLLPSLALAPQAEQQGLPDGVARYIFNKRDFDREAFQKATAEERRDIAKFIKEVPKPIALGIRNNVVCIGSDAAAVIQALDLLSKGDTAAKPMLPQHDISASINAQGILAQLGAGKESPFQALKEKAAANIEMAEQPPAVAEVLKLEIEALETFAAQVKTVDAGLDFSADEAKLALSLTALPETNIAKYAASVPSGLPELLKYIPQDCWVVAAMRMGDTKLFSDWGAQFTKRIMIAAGKTPEEAEKLAASSLRMRGCYGDQFAAGLRSGPGMRVVEAVRLNNLQTPELVNAQIDMMGTQFFGGMMKVKVASAEPVQYKGKTIGEWRFSFGEPTAQGAPEDPMKAMQRALIAQLLGDPMTVNYALVGSDWLISAGPDSIKSLKNILDEEAQPITALQSFKDIAQALPPRTQGIALVHITDALRQFLPMVQQMVPGALIANIERLDAVQRGPGMLLVLSGAPAGFTVTAKLPSSELRVISDAFRPAPVAERPKGCMQHLQEIGAALAAWKANHQGEMPQSLEKLAPEYVADAMLLRCPDSTTPVNGYDYSGALPSVLVASLPDQGVNLMIACDRAGYHPAGRNVLFSDGHIVFMGEKQFTDTLSKNMEALTKAARAKGIALSEAAKKFYGK